VKRISPVLVYTVFRLLTFAVPLTALLLMQINPLIATLLAALIGVSLSYIFLRPQREQVSRELYARRHEGKTSPHAHDDEDAEDAIHTDSTDAAAARPASEHRPATDVASPADTKPAANER
jgi:hypothetical protein